MSTLKATYLQQASSASPNNTLDASTNATVAGTLAMGSSFKRNRIINGDMRVDQRNAGASGTATGYTVDRWYYNASQSSKGTWQQDAGAVTPPVGFVDYLGFTSSSAYSVLTGDFFFFFQAIEGLNVADLGWGTANAKTVTLSFWARSSLTGTFGGSLRNSAANRSYPFAYTINSANTWEYKTVTIAGDTSGTWLTTNGVGMYVTLAYGAGATYSGTAGAWAAGNLLSATGATSVVGTNGATFYITGVQLEVGSVATPYERQIYSEQLAQCQRYYQVYGGSDGYLIGGNVNAASDQYSMVIFPVKMRASPTATSSGTWTTSNVTTTKPSINTVSASSACVYGSTSASGNWYFQANSSDDTLTFSAEL